MRTQGRQYQWRRKQEPIHRDWEDLHVFREWQPTLVGTQSSCLKLLGSQPTPVLLPGKSHGLRSLVGTVHGVAKSRAGLSDFPFTFHFHALEKEMATHSSVLAWRIPGTEEPSGRLSMGSHRVGHDWSDLTATAWNMKLKRFFVDDMEPLME